MSLAVLLPPSEGKAQGGDGRPWRPGSGRFGRRLRAPRLEVVDALADLDGGTARLLGVGGPTLERALAANRAVVGAPTLPAWQRFSGVVWEHLDVPSLDQVAGERAQSILVVSALTGVSALEDPLPDHRLKLSVALGPLGRLSTWWRPRISEVLDAHLRDRLVIDLLPAEHAAAWTPALPVDRHLRVRFVGRDGRIAGHTAKAAKGLLARDLVSSADPERTLATWRHPDVSLDIAHPSVIG